ncbi:MAG TPA: hypothetical protein PLL76_10215 [Thermoanaerobaculia bacterium]|nr:hypothetical protein [Thermoanaerobaculia bacterium]HQP86620.1 hypothetical protein [Thermoanaerobaculia bacterium]
MENGPEFTSRAMHCWARANGVRLHFIDPGKPWHRAMSVAGSCAKVARRE